MRRRIGLLAAAMAGGAAVVCLAFASGSLDDCAYLGDVTTREVASSWWPPSRTCEVRYLDVPLEQRDATTTVTVGAWHPLALVPGLLFASLAALALRHSRPAR